MKLPPCLARLASLLVLEVSTTWYSVDTTQSVHVYTSFALSNYRSYHLITLCTFPEDTCHVAHAVAAIMFMETTYTHLTHSCVLATPQDFSLHTTRYPAPSYPTHLLPYLQTSILVATDAATKTVTASGNTKAEIGAAKDRIGTDDTTTEPDYVKL